MTCADACPLEQSQFDEASPGVIGDNEILYRSGFSENLDGTNLKKKAINNKELLGKVSLSFWRAYDETPDQILAAEDKLRANVPAGKTIKKKIRPRAGDVRGLKGLEGQRLFCVLDDCAVDYSGGKDELHCGIRLCQDVVVEDALDPVYVNARDTLLELLNRSIGEMAAQNAC